MLEYYAHLVETKTELDYRKKSVHEQIFKLMEDD